MSSFCQSIFSLSSIIPFMPCLFHCSYILFISFRPSSLPFLLFHISFIFLFLASTLSSCSVLILSFFLQDFAAAFSQPDERKRSKKVLLTAFKVLLFLPVSLLSFFWHHFPATHISHLQAHRSNEMIKGIISCLMSLEGCHEPCRGLYEPS